MALWERTPGTYRIWIWVRPTTNLDAEEERKIIPSPGIEPRLFSPWPVAILTYPEYFVHQSEKPKTLYKVKLP
jgi:hypothetical protein